jgi:signal transduction histidine kinase
MINNSLTLSKLEDEQFPLRRELFDPSHLAHSLFEDALSLAKRKNIKLVSQSVNLPNELDADRDTLTRALENLVFNAIKFTPDSGEVSLRFETGGGRMSFTVEDTGPGIPEKVLPRIFSRYERGKFGESEGAGLGLAIAKLAAEAHGGDVEAENRASGGARFVFWIPVHTGN